MGKFSSILLGTISGAAAAVFLTSKKGKEVTAKVSDFMNEVKENPDDFKDQVVQKANHFSNQAAEAVNQAKEKVESGEITGETILDSVKEATKQVVDFSQEKMQEWKEKMTPEGISPEDFKKTEQEPVDKETTSEDIVIDLTENQESENEDKKIED
ncbi:YtxH domain-containing protein [Streptococcus anginosus]|uniref:YtxH domain-containing protein n=1 Tax=Streptococcus anginosus TaxID=1328 RepID=A0AAP2K5P5_STRAP|nr:MULTISPECIES: YtxH domain-containing protein [Streptococcus]MBF7050166.1 YtxH domain-containing protein [Streptococcus sp. HF-2466]MBF7075348.1 YtxH domain-containing protein [Streptococcus sp. HF-100]MBZ2155061.1 YtxH domain-containing protein [Streptococcus anginosus]MCY7232191.1 YtxH domain-containing protein [Streptococcus anginosus]PRT63557.1 YtxH domain-containing protein [Streptococcus anginosus]